LNMVGGMGEKSERPERRITMRGRGLARAGRNMDGRRQSVHDIARQRHTNTQIQGIGRIGMGENDQPVSMPALAIPASRGALPLAVRTIGHHTHNRHLLCRNTHNRRPLCRNMLHHLLRRDALLHMRNRSSGNTPSQMRISPTPDVKYQSAQPVLQVRNTIHMAVGDAAAPQTTAAILLDPRDPTL
jgi:hypothetical protein